MTSTITMQVGSQPTLRGNAPASHINQYLITMSQFEDKIGYLVKQGAKRYLTTDDKWSTNIGKAKWFDTLEESMTAIKQSRARTAYSVRHVHRWTVSKNRMESKIDEEKC